jgi:murein DD-endopeptidase MepM/ murein hydrolase activator NlpD
MILKKTLIVLPFLLSGFCLSAQDRYAATISYDKKVAALDSVIMEQLLQEEEEEGDLYEGLYESWSDTKVNPYGVDVRSIKDSFAIDCSGYYPPSLGKVTSHFGPRRRSFHNGIDLKVQVGDTIRAAFDGVVRVRRYNKGGYGYFLVLRHKNGLETVYGHLSRFLVASNDAIKAGDPIALGGNTGRSTGPHLHFEVRFLGNPINPAKMFSFEDYLPLKEAYYVVRDETFEERLRYMGVRVKNASGKYANVDYYTVRKGDVLGRIAIRNGISLSKLCQLNNIKSNSVIRPGQRLRLS